MAELKVWRVTRTSVTWVVAATEAEAKATTKGASHLEECEEVSHPRLADQQRVPAASGKDAEAFVAALSALRQRAATVGDVLRETRPVKVREAKPAKEGAK